jgi:hypothetical protein
MIRAVVTVEMRQRTPEPLWLRRHAPEVAFAALLLLGAVIVFYEARGFSFYFDDWEFVLHRRGVTANVLLSPHGPHLVLAPILIYKVLLKVFGGSSFLPFRFLVAFDMIVMALVLGIACRRAWGRWWGLAPVLLLVTLGSGAWSLLWSFQVGFALANAGGLVALLALTADGGWANAIACGALILSLASGSQGVGYLVGAAVLIVLRGETRRRAWVVVIPAVLYAVWYLKYGQQGSETELALWRHAVPNTMISFSSTISGLLGLGSPSSALPPQLSPDFGEPLALAAIVALALAIWRGWRAPPLFWAALTTLVVLSVAATLIVRLPTDSRYLPTDAILLLVCVCLAFPRPSLPRGGLIAVLAALLVIAATNAGQFTSMRSQMLTTDLQSRAQLGAMLIMRGLLPPYFTPAPPFGVGLANNVQAGPFFSAYDSFGLPADSVADLQAQGEGIRAVADQTLQKGEEVGYEFTNSRPSPAAAPPSVISGKATPQGDCLALNGGYVDVTAIPGTYVFVADRTGTLNTSAGRFATTYDIPFGVLPAGGTAVVHIPRDRAPLIPWRFLVMGHGRVCA